MPPVHNSLGGGYTHTNTQVHTHMDVTDKAILRNQACAWFKNVKSQVNNVVSLIHIQRVTYPICKKCYSICLKAGFISLILMQWWPLTQHSVGLAHGS